jgi:hypothetical protein
VLRFASSRLVLGLAFGLATLACTGDRPSALTASGAESGSLGLGGSSATPQLVTCAPATPQSTSALVGPLGGVLAIGNTRVVIPANALLAPTLIQLTIPASNNVEIEVKAGDADHFLFASLIYVTIDYGRCGSSLDDSALSVWHIDPSTHALLENMGGIDLKLFHTITFVTGHLSGYAIAD